MASRIARAEALLGTVEADVADRTPWDWYADGCPCGKPPGECTTHPRARPGQRAPGLQFDRLWADELCAWQYPQRMWELALLGLRMGTRPQAVVTTTPKPIAILRRLLDQPTTRLSRETTFANKLHLAPEFISE